MWAVLAFLFAVIVAFSAGVVCALSAVERRLDDFPSVREKIFKYVEAELARRKQAQPGEPL